MAENISIKVTTVGINGSTGALAKLTQLKGVVDYLNRTPVNINAGGLTQVSVQAGKAAQATQSAAKATKDYATATQAAAKQTTALGSAIDRLKLVATGAAVMAVVKSVREALTTMREVDQQLTNIQKVSGMTAAEIKKIGDAAYDTASKYGVAADKYLEAVYTFQKAGLGDSAEKLGELATKTMLVGDTTASVATKFLISANAAWKLGGNVEALSKIVDEADYINNNYAATLADIATGLPIVGATAAQVGMTTEQTMSAIATIVASTGQTASKASTALRAIIMNLIGQTGDLDEGISVTTDSIKSLNDVLKKYAPEALAAAQASGKILDPMEAIAALAKAAEDPLVKDTELFAVLASLGGKLRTTQLTALVNNLDMYNKMLAGTATAAGTADKEVSIMLESWNSKVQILKNAWTQFVQSFISSNLVKGGITVLTGLVKVLNSDFGKFAITVASTTAAVSLLVKALTALAPQLAGLKAIGLSGILSSLASSPTAWIATASAAMYGLVKLFDALNVSADEHLEKSKKHLENYKKAESEITSLNSKIDENNRLIKEGNEAGKSQEYISRLKAENELLEVQLKHQRDLAQLEKDNADKEARAALNATEYMVGTGQYERYVMPQTGGKTVVAETLRQGNILERAQYLFDKLAKGNLSAQQIIDFENELDKLVPKILDVAEGLDTTKEGAQEYVDAIARISKEYRRLKGLPDDIDELADSTDNATGKIEEQAATVAEAVDAFKAYNDAIDSVQSALSTLTAAQEEYNQNGELSVDTIQSLLALDAEYLDALIDENGQINLNSQAVSDLIDGKNILLERLAAEAIAEYAVKQAQELYNDQLAEVNGTASSAETAMGKLETAAANVGTAFLQASSDMAPFIAEIGAIAGEFGLDDLRTEVLQQRVKDYAENIKALLQNTSLGLGGWNPKGSGSSSRSGSGSGSSSGSSTDTQLAAHKSAVSLAKQKLSFASESGASTAEQVALMRAVQDALHKQAEYMRSIGAEEEDILKLSTEWWTYQNKINKALEDARRSYEDIRDEALALIDEEEARVIGPLQEQLDKLKAQRDAIKDERTEEERLLEVEKARIALANAQNERTVRQYNAATGQWEWVANAQNVATAQENLTEAETALDDFYRDREISKLEAKISSIQSDYDQKRAVADVKAQMQANSEAWFDADEATRKKLADENLKLGTAQGWTRGADGVWYDANGNRVYDGGGILRGTGGIKASVGDEMIIPPSMTARLLTAEATGAFDALLNHLGIVTSAANSYAGFGGGLTKNSIGEQHNGDTFYIDGIMMQNITGSTTLNELARTARTLQLRKGS